MASFVFPKLDLPKPQRSNRDLSHTVVGSFSCGPLYPVLALDVLPGDDIRVKLNALIESFPMLAPAMSGYKVSFDAYLCPWSNYYGWMSNDTRLSTEQIIKRRRHTLTIGPLSYSSQGFTAEDLRQSYVEPGSLLNFLGVPAYFFGQPYTSAERPNAPQVSPLEIPAERVLSYYDIFRHYYANNQQALFPIGSTDSVLPGTDSAIRQFSLQQLDTAFRTLRSQQDGVDVGNSVYAPFGEAYFRSVYSSDLKQGPYQGLCFRTYRMDLLRGILNSSVGTYKSTIDVSGDQISYDTILEAGKLFDLIQRIDVTGGRFSDWMWTRWHVKPYDDIHRPIYLGSVSETFGNVDVLAPSAGTQYDKSGEVISSSGAGQQTGFAVGRVNRDREAFRVRSNQYATFMIIMSMVPLVRYSQGFELNMLKTTFADIYDPAFSQIGYQDVSRFELSALPKLAEASSSTDGIVRFEDLDKSVSVGKRIAWSEYMGCVDRSVGDFAQGASLDYWAFNRVYTEDGNLTGEEEWQTDLYQKYGSFDMNTYVMPDVWNKLFAATDFDQRNFRFRVSFDIRAKRPIGNRVLPHS